MTFSIVIMVGRGYFLPTHVHEASEKQERDRAAWLKKMTAVLDKTLCDMEGKTYFDSVTQVQVADAIRRGGITQAESEQDPDDADDAARKAEKEEADK